MVLLVHHSAQRATAKTFRRIPRPDRCIVWLRGTPRDHHNGGGQNQQEQKMRGAEFHIRKKPDVRA